MFYSLPPWLHVEESAYSPTVYMICGSTSPSVHAVQRFVNVSWSSPEGWSSGIQRPLLKCQSGPAELEEAQAAVLDFPHHTPASAHKRISHPSPLAPQWAQTWWTPLFFFSVPLLSLSQTKAKKNEECAQELMSLLKWIIHVIVERMKYLFYIISI